MPTAVVLPLPIEVPKVNTNQKINPAPTTVEKIPEEQVLDIGTEMVDVSAEDIVLPSGERVENIVIPVTTPEKQVEKKRHPFSPIRIRNPFKDEIKERDVVNRRNPFDTPPKLQNPFRNKDNVKKPIFKSTKPRNRSKADYGYSSSYDKEQSYDKSYKYDYDNNSRRYESNYRSRGYKNESQY